MNNNVTPKQMPRVMPMPARSTPEYDPEVLAVAHKQLEAVRTIAALQEERDHWQRQCLSAQTEIARLEKRLTQEAQESETKLDKVGHALDYWKGECARVEAILQAGSRVFLQALEHKRNEREEASKMALAAVADAVDNDPMPRIVTAGPHDD